MEDTFSKDLDEKFKGNFSNFFKLFNLNSNVETSSDSLNYVNF
jgi:hypothetical protein